MSTGLIVPAAVALLAIAVLARAITIVPQGRAYVVERLGRYHRTLPAGLHVLAPFVDAVRHRYSLAEEALAVPGEECRTRDDRPVWVDATLTVRVTDPERATYRIADYRTAVAQLSRVTLRRAVADVELAFADASRAQIGATVVREMAQTTEPWGVTALRHEITDISRHKKESAA